MLCQILLPLAKGGCKNKEQIHLSLCYVTVYPILRNSADGVIIPVKNFTGYALLKYLFIFV